MTKTSIVSRTISLSLAIVGCILIGGFATEASAQGRDPFVKPGYARTRTPGPAGGTARSGKSGPGAAIATGTPSIEQRIDYYKRQREAAAMNGSELPKVTSVLTLDEMQVTGIFRTPRGYAAMVEATPIKLSYTIYPGEKFFDGQLVAVEENRLVFRRVVKAGQGKFVTSVENKPLRKYTTKEQIQGTAPVQAASDSQSDEPAASAAQASADNKPANVVPIKIVSPLDEMNSQPAAEEKAAKPAKKALKAANNKK